jgi:hypothetical protein
MLQLAERQQKPLKIHINGHCLCFLHGPNIKHNRNAPNKQCPVSRHYEQHALDVVFLLKDVDISVVCVYSVLSGWKQ